MGSAALGSPVRDRLPIWVKAWGVLAFPGAAYLVLRLVWEMTMLSWERGPQMVGFSLAHTGPFLELFASWAALFLWFVFVLIRTLAKLVRGIRSSPWRWAALGAAAAVFALHSVSYGTWIALSAPRLVRGPHAAEFATHAAATGSKRAVAALIAAGMPVDARSNSGQTSLHAAAVGGQVDVIRFLIEKGADVNAVDDGGDSPLEEAESMHRDAAAALLRAHGAVRLRGDEARHEAAARAFVERTSPGVRGDTAGPRAK